MNSKQAWIMALLNLPRCWTPPSKISQAGGQVGKPEEQIMAEEESAKNWRKDMEAERIRKKQEKNRRKRIRTAKNKKFKNKQEV